MSLWTIEPRDPLVVRDGRPNNGRSESASLAFPYPSTIAGVVRTRLGSDEHGVFNPDQDLPSLLRTAIRGPLLATASGEKIYVPAPRDAVVVERALRRLVPMDAPSGAMFDKHAFIGRPVGLVGDHAGAFGKPVEAPAWWPWDLFEHWLGEPGALDGGDAVSLLSDGVLKLPVEARSHVKLTETWTAEDGMLFQTRGLRFLSDKREPLALLVDLDAATIGDRKLRAGIGPSGGERRLAHWAPARLQSLPVLPKAVRTALEAKVSNVTVRVVLLTPAIFTGGWKPGDAPGQLLGPRAGITPTLVAACVPRPDTISGWDFAKRRPKMTRRLVPAGSVYWLDLGGTPDSRIRWAEEVMMHNVSDKEQDQSDGFGLAVVGVGS